MNFSNLENICRIAEVTFKLNPELTQVVVGSYVWDYRHSKSEEAVLIEILEYLSRLDYPMYSQLTEARALAEQKGPILNPSLPPIRISDSSIRFEKSDRDRRDSMALGIFNGLISGGAPAAYIEVAVQDSVKLADKLIAALDKPRDGK